MARKVPNIVVESGLKKLDSLKEDFTKNKQWVKSNTHIAWSEQTNSAREFLRPRDNVSAVFDSIFMLLQKLWLRHSAISHQQQQQQQQWK